MFLEPHAVLHAVLSAEAVEVLLRQEAFVVKRGGGGAGSKGQISWKKHPTVAQAWDAAKQKANWPTSS